MGFIKFYRWSKKRDEEKKRKIASIKKPSGI